MKEVVCQNNSSGTSSLFKVTDSVGKVFTGIDIARQRVGENHSSGTESPDKATCCLKNYTEQMTERKKCQKLH